MKKSKIISIIFYLLTPAISVIGQDLSRYIEKPPIDTSVFDKWPSVGNPAISNDGKYFLYKINNQPVGSSTLILQSIIDNWKREFQDVSNANFTDDNRKAIFIKSNDSLCILTLGSSSIIYIPGVQAFKIFKKNRKEWVAYHLKTPDKKLVLLNLETGDEKIFKDVNSYLFSDSGMVLSIQEVVKKVSDDSQFLKWLDFSNDKLITFWQGYKPDNFVFDAKETQLAFSIGDNNSKSIWYYITGANKAVLLADNQSAGIDNGLKLDRVSSFSKDGSRLFLTLKEQEYAKPNLDAIKIDIWNYRDVKLQSQQLYELTSGEGGPHSYTAVINIDDHHIIRLSKENESAYLFGANDNMIGVTNRKGGDQSEWNWNAASLTTFYIISTQTGERKLSPINYPNLSLGGKYLIGTDSNIPYLRNNLFSYNLETGHICNMTKSLRVPMDEVEVVGLNSLKQRNLQVARWLPDDKAVLIYDKYDIWHIDPSGKKAPINLTNGYGRKHNIVFRLSGTQEFYDKTIAQNAHPLLSAFNLTNKNSGFYRMNMSQSGNPELLIVGPHIYKDFFYTFAPLKAQDAEVYVVQRETAEKSPNYFWTKDFKTYTALTCVYPEKDYNWLTSELLTFKTLDGRTEQGALYKPENFDSKKKYPIIIHYYEEMSNKVNAYHRPGATGDNINIPWFVSHGYLVFTPDIHYTIGTPGQSAYNSVVACAKYLTKFSWVDAARMGIQGHSWGGFETNDIVTHTNLFAAAMSSSGPSDFISGYGSVSLTNGESNQYFYEVHQSRIGATLWQRPDLYIINSPILRTNKVTTPFLMMNNKKDGAVAFAQGVEFFTALRRLGKRAWMLQYDDGRHTLSTEKDAIQHTIRINQFFDHYLKGAPAPKWMTRGIPAKMKGIDDGLELDYEIKTPGEGLLTAEEKKKVEALQNRKPITIKL